MFFRVLLVPFAALSLIAQTTSLAPVPSDPHELVTGVVKVLDESDQRATVLGLIERARQNSDLHAPGGHPYSMRAWFEASGNVAQTGPGWMEETWLSAQQWRWSASLGSYAQTRITTHGRMFDENVGLMPIRLHMLRGAIFWPIHMGPGGLLRIAPAVWNNAPVMCVLASPFGTAAASSGRGWDESEFCIDTTTGLLQTYSVAPGIYVVYDYHDALHFHASTLPGKITIYEGANVALDIRVERLGDAAQVAPALFTPSAKAMAQSSGPTIAGQFHYVLAAGPAPLPLNVVQPVIVHAVLDPEGKVAEAETLPTVNPTLSTAALELVRNSVYPPQQQGRPIQREAFIDVRYRPPNTHSD